jgi:hypothetical protein
VRKVRDRPPTSGRRGAAAVTEGPRELDLGPGTGTSGGAAIVSGAEFQHRAAATLAVRLLAEQAAPALWEMKPRTTLEELRCEAQGPVDDIVVSTSQQGRASIQATEAHLVQ